MSKREQRQRAARAQRLRAQKARSQQIARSSRVGPRADPAALMQTAVTLHQTGKLKQAEKLYLSILAADPEHADALSSLAMIRHQAGRYAPAIKLLYRAIAKVDDNPGYFMNLGTVQTAAGQLQDAEQSYRRAIKLAPGYADPYYNLGDLYLRLGDAEAAIAVFDACMAARGRDYHALAYKAHALVDAGRHEEARYLLDFDRYVKAYPFEAPEGFASNDAFNTALAEHVQTHPTLRSNVMSTEHGKHTGELLRMPRGPMGPMELRIHEAVRWYIANLPDDPDHPAVRWVPGHWKLTTWGVVMLDKGHERAHIHPNGWLSGVFYLQLPDLIDDPDRNHEGWLEFGRPTRDLHVKSDPVIRHHKPACGEMVLFPSYFYHGTIPFRSRQQRICVAFDVEPLD